MILPAVIIIPLLSLPLFLGGWPLIRYGQALFLGEKTIGTQVDSYKGIGLTPITFGNCYVFNVDLKQGTSKTARSYHCTRSYINRGEKVPVYYYAGSPKVVFVAWPVDSWGIPLIWFVVGVVFLFYAVCRSVNRWRLLWVKQFGHRVTAEMRNVKLLRGIEAYTGLSFFRITEPRGVRFNLFWTTPNGEAAQGLVFEVTMEDTGFYRPRDAKIAKLVGGRVFDEGSKIDIKVDHRGKYRKAVVLDNESLRDSVRRSKNFVY